MLERGSWAHSRLRDLPLRSWRLHSRPNILACLSGVDSHARRTVFPTDVPGSLAALACGPGAEAELRADAGLRHAAVLMAGQRFEEAAAAGAAVHRLAVAAGLQLDAVRALLLLAKVNSRSRACRVLN